jgi:hypothetical protein
VALGPLAFSLALGWLVTTGPFGFGGGEKDIFLVFPLAAWSLVFCVSSLVMGAAKAPLARSTKVSALVALGALVAAVATFAVLTWR